MKHCSKHLFLILTLFVPSENWLQHVLMSMVLTSQLIVEEPGPVADGNHHLRSYWQSDAEDNKPIVMTRSPDQLTKFVQREGDVFDEFLQRWSHPSAATPDPVTSDPEEEFEIPVLPQGRHLVIRVLSTWGDRRYVGLNGVEIFSASGEPVAPHQITAVMNGLSEVNGDISKVTDGVYRTQDDSHMWLAPFVAEKRCEITLDLGETQRLAMIRVWNYNKSRIHSFRGVRDVDMLLDGRRIFRGEIAKASGTLLGGVLASRSQPVTRGRGLHPKSPHSVIIVCLNSTTLKVTVFKRGSKPTLYSKGNCRAAVSNLIQS